MQRFVTWTLSGAVALLSLGYAACGASAVQGAQPTAPATDDGVAMWLTQEIREDGSRQATVVLCDTGSSPACVEIEPTRLGDREVQAWLERARTDAP